MLFNKTVVTPPKPAAPLAQQLGQKSTDLFERSDDHAERARNLAEAAVRAEADSEIARKKAEAIEKARIILEDAGVTE